MLGLPLDSVTIGLQDLYGLVLTATVHDGVLKINDTLRQHALDGALDKTSLVKRRSYDRNRLHKTVRISLTKKSSFSPDIQETTAYFRPYFALSLSLTAR